MDNSKEIFSLALGLSQPWFVEKINFETTSEGKALHIYVSFVTYGNKSYI